MSDPENPVPPPPAPDPEPRPADPHEPDQPEQPSPTDLDPEPVPTSIWAGTGGMLVVAGGAGLVLVALTRWGGLDTWPWAYLGIVLVGLAAVTGIVYGMLRAREASRFPDEEPPGS